MSPQHIEASPHSKNLSTLEKLPRELIYMIVDDIPECALILRQVSRLLRDIVNENIVNLRNVDSKMEAGVNDPEMRKVFHLALILQSPSNITMAIRRKPGASVSEHRSIFIISMSEDGNGKGMGEVEFSMDSVTDDELYLRMEHLSLRKVNMVTDQEIIATFVNPVAFLLTMSSLCRSIGITQSTIHGINNNSKYLFGLYNCNWAHIIFAMFSNSNHLDKMCIENTAYPAYLTLKNANMLRERLPNIGKPIWFQASCNKYSSGLFHASNVGTTNQHFVQAKRPLYKSECCALVIRHWIRQTESFWRSPEDINHF